MHDVMADEEMGLSLGLLLSFSPCLLPSVPFVARFAFRLSLPLCLALGLKARRRDGARSDFAASLRTALLLRCFTASQCSRRAANGEASPLEGSQLPEFAHDKLLPSTLPVKPWYICLSLRFHLAFFGVARACPSIRLGKVS